MTAKQRLAIIDRGEPASGAAAAAQLFWRARPDPVAPRAGGGSGCGGGVRGARGACGKGVAGAGRGRRPGGRHGFGVQARTGPGPVARQFGLAIDPPVARFIPITLANRATLDYLQQENFDSHHYAFLVTDEEFDPACHQPDQIYRSHGRRGTYFRYFRDPNGHLTEILTPAS
jgi:hypothetical protein